MAYPAMQLYLRCAQCKSAVEGMTVDKYNEILREEQDKNIYWIVYVSNHKTASTNESASVEELSRNNPIPSGDVSADVAFTLKNNTLDVNNVGRLAVLLAWYAYYGDEVLQESTLKGKGK